MSLNQGSLEKNSHCDPRNGLDPHDGDNAFGHELDGSIARQQEFRTFKGVEINKLRDWPRARKPVRLTGGL
jgi:hypothetical protein